MDLIQFSDWLSSTAPSQAIQISRGAIPGIQTVHIVALSLLFAAALVLSLRIAGRGLAAEPLQQLSQRFARLIWVLLAVLVVSGGLLILAEPGRTLTNPVFFAKMIMLVIVVTLTAWLASAVRRGVTQPSGLMVAAATLCMLLWIGIIFAGRLIAYYEPY